MVLCLSLMVAGCTAMENECPTNVFEAGGKGGSGEHACCTSAGEARSDALPGATTPVRAF
jgi:hypothetical protein